MKKIQVDVWSDVACPWCYIGKRRLEAAIKGFEHGDAVEVVWHAFELDRSAPPASDAKADFIGRLATKYRVSNAQAEGMIERVKTTAAADGIDMRFDRIRPGNTFDAHRLIHLASDHDKQDAMKERLLRAYFTDGEKMSDHATLTRLAAEVGLDPAEVTAMLASDAHASAVRDDEDAASTIGITGVPFFAVAERYAVSGAQTAELLRGVLAKAWAEAGVEPVASSPSKDGAACGPAGCD